MVLNKTLGCLKLFRTGSKLVQQSTRNHTMLTYRTIDKPPRHIYIMSEVLGGFMWFWILYHTFTEPGHLIGEFPYPDPSKWTDEELGIPPDDAE